MSNVEQAKKCLTALGSAWRNNWFDFDGRTLRSELEDIQRVLDGEMTYEQFLNTVGIDEEQLIWKRDL